MTTQTTNAPQSVADRAGAAGHETSRAARDVAGTAGQEAAQVGREAADAVRRLWGQTRSDLTDQAASQQTRVAGGLRELSDQLGQMAGAGDQGGMARDLVEDVARRAGGAADWLDQRDPGSLLDEARSFARRRPGTFLALAAGIGLAAGRMGRSLVDEARDTESPDGGSAVEGGANDAAPQDDSGGTSTADGTVPAPTSMEEATPVTPGASPQSDSTLPSAELPGVRRTTQPIEPDGTPAPIGADGHLTARDDDGSVTR
jgi:hypothetical protein